MGLFDEQISRKPDLYPWGKSFIDAMQEGFWRVKEFSFSSDLHDFKVNLSVEEKEMIVKCLALIGQLEISVKKFWAKLGDNLPHPAMNDLGYVMANVEVIHGHAYEKLLEVLGLDNAFDDILTKDIVKGRVNYLRKHLHKFHADNRKQFVYSLILFTLFVENIALFSQFYTIMWFGKSKNVLKDTNKQVEYTSREEDLHAKVGIKLINELRKEYPELFDEELAEKVRYEAGQGVKYECEIIDWTLGDYKGIGPDGEALNADVLKEFMKDRLNNSLLAIGYNVVFDVDRSALPDTKWFHEQLFGNNMTDFFNARPVEYAKKNQSFDASDLFDEM